MAVIPMGTGSMPDATTNHILLNNKYILSFCRNNLTYLFFAGKSGAASPYGVSMSYRAHGRELGMKAVGPLGERERLMRIPGRWRRTVFSSGASFAPLLFQQAQAVQPCPASFSNSGLFDLPGSIRSGVTIFKDILKDFPFSCVLLCKRTIQILKTTHFPK